MVELAESAARGIGDSETLLGRLAALANGGYVDTSDTRMALVEGWEAAVGHFLDDSDLGADEERHLSAFRERFSLEQNELDTRGAFSRVLRAAILKDLLDGRVPERIQVAGNAPFNFQKNEQIVYVFSDVEYLEDRSRTQYVGAYSGVSVRVMKGVYFRTGGFRGEPVSATERTPVDKGYLCVTTRHLCFGGETKSFRIQHAKIVSYTPYADGIAIVRDVASARAQVFITGDGWFTYNLLANVAKLSANG